MKKQIKKCKKRCKRNISLKGGTGNKVTYNHNNREIILIGVNHLERGITMNDMREIIQMGNKKSNVCYYIEFDKTLTKKQTLGKIPNTGELTTKIIMPYLKKEFRHVWNNMCIKGWDVRQSLIGQKNQDILYSQKIYNQTVGNIITNYIEKISIKHKIDLSKYSINIGNFLKRNFDDEKTYFNFRKQDGYSGFDWLYMEVNKFIKYEQNLNRRTKLLNNYTLGELRKIFKQEDIDNLINNLRKAFANYSDLILLENILQKNNKKTYIIFQGLEHYNNVKNHMKNLKIK